MTKDRNEGFEDELSFWDLQLSLNGQFREDILNRSVPERYANVFPHFILEYINDLSDQNPNRVIKVIDVGSGPLSLLVYGHHIQKFELTAVDPLTDEYKRLLKKYKYDISYPLLTVAGEELEAHLGKETFDLVWCRNALDHSNNPSKAFSQMVKILRPGGYLILQSFAMEATAQNWHGLHQHDIYLNENYELMCRSKVSDGFQDTRLDSNHSLQVVTSTEPTQEVKGWIQIVWKKGLD